MVIVDPYDVYNDILSERTASLSQYIVPIYAPKPKNKRPVCVGTGTLITRNNKNFIVTAKHVIDQNTKSGLSLYVPGSNNLEPIVAQAHIAEDLYDIGIIEVSETTTRNLLDKEFNFYNYVPRAGKFSTDKFMCAYLGFPTSQNEGYNGKIRPKPYSYRGFTLSDEETINVTATDLQYVMPFEVNQIRDVAGNQKTFPAHHGLSGGGLWTIGFVKVESMLGDDFEPTLVGFLIHGRGQGDTTYNVFTSTVVLEELLKKTT